MDAYAVNIRATLVAGDEAPSTSDYFLPRFSTTW